MTLDKQTIEVDGETIRSGTAIFDSKFDRVLWVTGIDDYELTVEAVGDYTDDEPIWWSTDGDPTAVADGSRITIDQFEELVSEGRFEIGPQPAEKHR